MLGLDLHPNNVVADIEKAIIAIIEYDMSSLKPELLNKIFISYTTFWERFW